MGPAEPRLGVTEEGDLLLLLCFCRCDPEPASTAELALTSLAGVVRTTREIADVSYPSRRWRSGSAAPSERLPARPPVVSTSPATSRWCYACSI